ncbi:MAG: hypothetical protein LIR50_05365 [Bacillota bacterium]|nr:hypothetical protein [Bacillota bacterium]
MKCRLKSATVFSFRVIGATCYYSGCPQQKWEYQKNNDDTVTVDHKGFTMVISTTEFNNNFKLIDK